MTKSASAGLAGIVLLFPWGCGKKADPLPPIQHVPAEVREVSIRQRGDFVELRWEAPRRTAQGSPKVDLETAEVLRRVIEAPSAAPAEAAPPAGSGVGAEKTEVGAAVTAVSTAEPRTGAAPISPSPEASRPRSPSPEPSEPGRKVPPAAAAGVLSGAAPPEKAQPSETTAVPSAAEIPAGAQPSPSTEASTASESPPPPKPFLEEAVVVATLEVEPNGGPVSYRETWESGWEGKRLEYAVRHRNRKGRVSAPSPPLALHPVRPLAAPSGLSVEAADGFVLVSWDERAGSQEAFDVYRRDGGASFPSKPANGEPLRVSRYQDVEAPFGVPLCYVVRRVAVTEPTGASTERVERALFSIESEDSAEACLTAEDTFPPPAPVELLAVRGVDSVLVSWKPVESPDLKGYRVYRSARREGPYELLTIVPVEAATYADRGRFAPEVTYFYRVTAVDGASPANESPPSYPVSPR